MNLFFVYGSGADARMMTPAPTGSLLHGITRDSLLKLGPDLGIPTHEGRISVDGLAARAAPPARSPRSSPAAPPPSSPRSARCAARARDWTSRRRHAGPGHHAAARGAGRHPERHPARPLRLDPPARLAAAAGGMAPARPAQPSAARPSPGRAAADAASAGRACRRSARLSRSCAGRAVPCRSAVARDRPVHGRACARLAADHSEKPVPAGPSWPPVVSAHPGQTASARPHRATRRAGSRSSVSATPCHATGHQRTRSCRRATGAAPAALEVSWAWARRARSAAAWTTRGARRLPGPGRCGWPGRRRRGRRGAGRRPARGR